MVDDEHKEVFQNKIFLSFRRAKNLKDELVRAKLPSVGEPPLAKGTYRCNGRKSCQICNVITEGDSFENSYDDRSFKNFAGGITAIQKTLCIYYNVKFATKNM